NRAVGKREIDGQIGEGSRRANGRERVNRTSPERALAFTDFSCSTFAPLVTLPAHEIAGRRDHCSRETHALSPRSSRPRRQIRVSRASRLHTRERGSTARRLERTIAPARCHATSFDQIRAVLRNSRRAHGPKRRHAARSIHLDGRELVWTHEIHYLNPGEMINRALRTLY